MSYFHLGAIGRHRPQHSAEIVRPQQEEMLYLLYQSLNLSYQFHRHKSNFNHFYVCCFFLGSSFIVHAICECNSLHLFTFLFHVTLYRLSLQFTTSVSFDLFPRHFSLFSLPIHLKWLFLYLQFFPFKHQPNHHSM